MKTIILDKILSQIQNFISSKSQIENDEIFDVPYVQSIDKEYITHRTLEEKEESPEEKEEIPTEEEPKEESPEEKEEIPTEEEPVPEESSEEPMSGEGRMELGEEEPKNPSEIGRVYELKKIYSRLISIESYLSTSSDITLLNLRNFISQAIDLFETLASNLDSYQDKLNEIIIMFYKFINIVYILLKQYYEKKDKENKYRRLK